MNNLLLSLLISATLVFSDVPIFTSTPTITKSTSNDWIVNFTLNTATDVAVSIVNIADSTVLRHLAAGVLGSKAPAPLEKNSLSQTLIWDGKDDLGRVISVPDANIRVRVRAGMSTQLVGIFGGNPYTLGLSGYQYATYVYGIVSASDGSVYVIGTPAQLVQYHNGGTFLTVRKYTKNGDYVQTVFPPPANLTQSEVAGWGVNNNPDGSYIPKNENTSMPMFTTSLLCGTGGHPNTAPTGSLLQYIDKEGKLVWGALKKLAFPTDGSLPGDGSGVALISTPTLPKYFHGYCFQTPLRNGKILMSGLFHVDAPNPTTIPQTNFYRDGKVFIIDPATKTASDWLTLDSVPQSSTERVTKLGGSNGCATIQGTAVDSTGRVYVCNRLHKTVGIYDSNAVFLGSIPVQNPHRVALGSNGNIYVLTHSQATWSTSSLNNIKLIKYAPFENGGAPICTMTVVNKIMGTSWVNPISNLSVNDAGGETTVWVGGYDIGVIVYKDNGNNFSIIRDMNAYAKAHNELGAENPTPDRLVIDRVNENLYISDSWYSLYEMDFKNNAFIKPCSNNAGKRIYGTDLTISPSRLLYVNGGVANGMFGNYSPPITRYTLDAKHASVPFSNTNKDTVTPTVYARWAPCVGARGLAVSPDGRVAAMSAGYISRSVYYVGVYGDSGSDAASYGKIQISPMPAMSGCVKYDLKGDLYVGSGIRTTDFVTPTNFLTDAAYPRGVGSIVKFSGTDSGSVGATYAPGSSKIYTIPLAPFSQDKYGMGNCVCRSPRFELDPYGRIFAPNAVTCQVTVADNEGNIISQFGKYGNIDSRGNLPGLPHQVVITGSEIPMAWPTSVAASEDYIYVSDYINYRIIRVKMVYATDNMPNLTNRESSSWHTPLFTLSSGPVPFVNKTVISVGLPERSVVKLEVFDAKGRRILRLADGQYAPGVHRFVWNGRDGSGIALSGGMYVYRLITGNRVLTSKTIIVK